jgi:hypothetical protein
MDMGSTCIGSPVQGATCVERQTSTRWEVLSTKIIEVFVVPAIAGIPGLEDVTVVAQIAGSWFTTDAEIGVTAYSRAI